MCLFFFIKTKRLRDAEREKPARFVCGEWGAGGGVSDNIIDSLTVDLSEK
jgi:hypothetical protein